MKRPLFSLMLISGLFFLITSSSLALARREPPRDGAWIAFASQSPGKVNLNRMLADGSQLEHLGVGQFAPSAWSPKGDWLTFTNYDVEQEQYDLYRIRPSGQEYQRISHAPQLDLYPAWSPDGLWITFADRYKPQIYKMSSDGHRVEPITQVGGHDNSPAWSPDGQWIVFSSLRDGNSFYQLYKMRPDGSDVQRLTDTVSNDLFPSWSLDGQWIAFTSTLSTEGNDEICLIRPDGSEMRRVTYNPSHDRAPAWSPDGQWIIFQSNRYQNWQLFRIRPDGSDVQQLTYGKSDNAWPSISPFYNEPWHASVHVIIGSTLIVLGLVLRRWKIA